MEKDDDLLLDDDFDEEGKLTIECEPDEDIHTPVKPKRKKSPATSSSSAKKRKRLKR